MNNRVLVTGASGFVGAHLLPMLLARDYDVVAVGRESSKPNELPDVEWVHGDLLDASTLGRLPTNLWGVVHLAGETVPGLFSSTASTLTNVAMTLNVAERLEGARFLFVSSCHVYAPSDYPLTESSLLKPRGRYGLSKLLGEQAITSFEGRLDVRIARPFNHLGPRMRRELMAPSLLRRIVSERGSAQPLKMYGLDSTRDFLDVRDIADAYIRVLELEALESESGPQIFNVCSGAPLKVSQLAAAALELAGDSPRRIEFQGSANSTDDTDYLVGDASALRKATGWRPKYSVHESLEAMLAADL